VDGGAHAAPRRRGCSWREPRRRSEVGYQDAAELFGSAPVLGYKGSGRIAQATRPDPLRVPPRGSKSPPGSADPHPVPPEGTYTLVTMPGVFSWDHLDDGTALLLDHLHVVPDTDVLDIGCGGGIIGLAAARAGGRVVMVDDDLLAVRCARAQRPACGWTTAATIPAQ